MRPEHAEKYVTRVMVCQQCGRYYHARGPNVGVVSRRRFCDRTCYYLHVRGRIDHAKRFWSKVDRGTPDACWLWQAGVNARGYGRIGWGDRHSVALAHRVAWELTHGAIPAGKHVLHACDIPACVNPAHLRLGTDADNMRDMLERGRSWMQRRPELAARGSRNGNARFTEAQVAAIRVEYAAGGVSIKALARRHRVAEYGMSLLLKRRTWRHVP